MPWPSDGAVEKASTSRPKSGRSPFLPITEGVRRSPFLPIADYNCTVKLKAENKSVSRSLCHVSRVQQPVVSPGNRPGQVRSAACWLLH